ncbi:MAG: Hsp20/alpha crystallin family protein [bacterium]|nr:Hsp20/alpha crystallin family protein [bacterium]
MIKKKSFFERLAGGMSLGDEERELPIKIEDDGKGKDKDAWEDEGEEGQLAVDVYQNPDEIVIEAMIAGVKPEDLNVSITRDMVTIRGRRQESREVSEDNYFYKELYWGSFSRTVLLPHEIDIEASEASEKHGLLTVTLPKVDKGKQAKLRVKSM